MNSPRVHAAPSPAATLPSARRATWAWWVVSWSPSAVLGVLALTIAQAPAGAWEAAAAARASANASGVPLPAALQSPPFPVLPGVVGPDMAADAGVRPEDRPEESSAEADAARGLSVQNATARTFVSPAKPTWDQAAEGVAAQMAGQRRPAAHGGDGEAWFVVLVVGAAIGTLAALAAVLNRSRHQMNRQPLPIRQYQPNKTATR